jgi:hypothetical protein
LSIWDRIELLACEARPDSRLAAGNVARNPVS